MQIDLAVGIQTALRGTHCQTFSADLRVRVSSRMYTYPDRSVAWGKPQYAEGRQDTLLNPAVIFEILSPSTEAYDRGLKLRHYRSIESLQDYILVSQDQILVEQYTRGEGGAWTFRDYSGDDTLLIPSIGVSLPLARVYEHIEFTTE